MKTRELIQQALVAAIYVALVYIFAWMSYGDIQFRIAEVLLVFIFFNPKYIVGLTLGTVIANLNSPLGVIDWVVGAAATMLSLLLMLYFKNKHKGLALLMPAMINGLIVGLMLHFVLSLPLLPSILTVFIGEFVVVFFGGGIVYKVIRNNHAFIKLIN